MPSSQSKGEGQKEGGWVDEEETALNAGRHWQLSDEDVIATVSERGRFSKHTLQSVLKQHCEPDQRLPELRAGTGDAAVGAVLRPGDEAEPADAGQHPLAPPDLQLLQGLHQPPGRPAIQLSALHLPSETRLHNLRQHQMQPDPLGAHQLHVCV
ncbi:hypothetical protein GOP47_0000444 [Adiantum capillus-veneris]|uniref:Uncharacterized protein n=1 Tax=Adiantum capillus-veneris TaxID=13818 RepID=A0A9D4VDY9_ADICA|nr:hypothetical protein GOP47_0030694 [Adiantum capillus-veneris]KAI5084275.1 hypothetical protein GOP47_0000444 [Adiantum capillus-veneris]